MNVPLQQKKKPKIKSGEKNPVPTESKKFEDVDAGIDDNVVSFEYPHGEKQEFPEDEDIEDDEADDLTIHTYVAVAGFQFYNKESEEMREPKFMMKTFDEKKQEHQRDIYTSSQIKKDFMFNDGPVVYPNDTVPKLDRESLGWDGRLVDQNIKSTWSLRGVKTTYSGIITAYDEISQQHTVLWDDETTDCFDVMGTWHKNIIEWRFYDDEEKLQSHKEKSVPSAGGKKRTTVSALVAAAGDNLIRTRVDKAHVLARSEGDKGTRVTPPSSLYKTHTRVEGTSLSLPRTGVSLPSSVIIKTQFEITMRSLGQIKNLDAHLHTCLLHEEAWLSDAIIDTVIAWACEGNPEIFRSCTSIANLVPAWEIEDTETRMSLKRTQECTYCVVSTFAYVSYTNQMESKSKVKGTSRHFELHPRELWGFRGGWNDIEASYILIPLHCDDNHWALAILCLGTSGTGKDDAQPCILFLDSCAEPECTKYTKRFDKKAQAIRVYLNTYAKITNMQYTDKNLPLFHAKVPQQDNGYDCGMFLLEFIIRFVNSRNKTVLFKNLLQRDNGQWFSQQHPGSLRRSVFLALRVPLKEELELEQQLLEQQEQQKKSNKNQAKSGTRQPDDSEDGHNNQEGT